MKLYLNKASPYARLVLAVAHEKGLAKDLELVWTDPWASEEKLLAVTPFSKVPALIADDGLPLIESACICDYLDERGEAPRLIPASGAARLAALRKVGLGRGLIDASFGAVIQKRFGGDRNSVLIERWNASVMRAVTAIDDDLTLSLVPDLGDVVIAVALGYIDFRMAEVKWRAKATRLSAWHDRMSARASMIATAPE
ncbi:MAG: glutathione S-transferase family protein [Burkholderiales bacterium]